MKKKIFSAVAILTIAVLMMFSLVGCTQFNATQLFDDEEYQAMLEDLNERITVELKESNFFKNNNNTSLTHLTGSLYKVVDNDTSNVGLYDVNKDKYIIDLSKCSMQTMNNNLVVVTKDTLCSIYLSDGSLLASVTADYLISVNVSQIYDYEFAKDRNYTYYGYTIAYVQNGVSKHDYIIAKRDKNYSYTITSGKEFATDGNKLEVNATSGERYGLPGYTVSTNGNSILTFKNGKLKSTLNMTNDDLIIDIKDGYVIYANVTAMPEESKKYSYIASVPTNSSVAGVKISQIVKSFNMKTGATKEIDFDYAIDDTDTYGDATFLLGRKINKDKTLDAQNSTFVIGKKGKIVEVKGLSPVTANSFEMIDENKFLWVGNSVAYIVDKNMKIKADLSALNFGNYSIDRVNKVIYAGQTIYGETRYGAVNFDGEVVLGFDFDENLIDNVILGKRFAYNLKQDLDMVVIEGAKPTATKEGLSGFDDITWYSDYGVALVTKTISDETTYELWAIANEKKIAELESSTIVRERTNNGGVIRFTDVDGNQRMFVFKMTITNTPIVD